MERQHVETYSTFEGVSSGHISEKFATVYAEKKSS